MLSKSVENVGPQVIFHQNLEGAGYSIDTNQPLLRELFLVSGMKELNLNRLKVQFRKDFASSLTGGLYLHPNRTIYLFTKPHEFYRGWYEGFSQKLNYTLFHEMRHAIDCQDLGYFQQLLLRFKNGSSMGDGAAEEFANKLDNSDQWKVIKVKDLSSGLVI